MAVDPIASARIELELNDDAVVAGLQRVDREYAKTMRDIDRQRAEAKVTLDTSGYDDAIKNIRREMKELDGRKATGDADLDTKTFTKKMKALRKELRDVEGQKATVELKLKGEEEIKKAQRRIQQANEKMVDAIELREKKRQHEYQKAEARRLSGVRNEARVSAALNRQRERELASAHGFALKLNREMDRAAENRQRDLASIPKLQREYAELTTKIEQLGSARRKAFGDKRAQVLIDLKVAETQAKMEALVKSLERIGSDVDLRINFKSGEALGAQVRKGLQQGGMLVAAYELGTGLGKGILEGIKSTLSPQNVARIGTGVIQKAGSILDSISSAAVRIGPFTASIRALVVVMSVLGPTVVDLVGAMGSLVGVMGTGLLGAAGISAGAIGALGVALGGVGILLPSLFRDFKNLTSIQKAYHVQVLKTGANSDKAKKKLKEFNHALGEVQPTTREAFLNLDRLSDRWNKMAQEVKPQFFDAMGASLLTVNKHFSWFSDNTKRSFTILTGAWDDWMKALRGDEATVILHTLGSNGRRSLRPLLDAFGNLITWFGRIATAGSNYLPALSRQFRDWTQGVADGVAPTTDLGERFERLVNHAKSLGRFLGSAGALLTTFFNGGADSGAGFLDTMAEAMDRWTEFLRNTEGQQGLRKFFDNSVKGAQSLYSVLAPIISTFVVWAQKMSPIVTGFLEGAGAVASFTSTIIRLVGLQDSVSALAVTLGTFWAIGKIQSATLAVTGFARAMLGLSAASTVANAGGAAASGGLLSKILGGGGGRVIGPAEKKFGNVIGSAAMNSLKFAGLAGVGIAVMSIIGKGMGTMKAREGFQSSIVGLSRDVLSTFSLGIADSAEESSRKAAAAIGGALRRNMNMELSKNIKLGGKGLNTVTTLDLTVDQRKMARNFQVALQTADRIARNHKLPDLTQAIKITSNPNDLRTIERNFERLKNNLATTTGNIRRNSDSTLQAISRSMDTNTRQGQLAVERNMGASVLAITRNMGSSKKAVTDAMSEIRHQFKVNSEASKRSADVNFGAAKTAIQMAVKDGQLSSKRGLAEIRKLWVSYLKLYGFSEKQATNISKGNSFTGGPEEGTRGPGRSGTQKKASGGLINIGTPGQHGRDSVPMNLGGVPAIVAPGEQIAVFNRHQQKAINQKVPGGLEGFFAANKRPHHMAQGGLVNPQPFAGGGIVPVPGFPGESAAASVIPMIVKIAKQFGLVLTDAFGQGHQSPGHTQFGTAADFAGPDASMDAAVKSLVAAGYVVGYDGRYGSADWPGHGPAAGQGGSNAHLHVELGGKGGGGLTGGGGLSVEAEQIKRQMAAQGLGAVTIGTQKVLDTVLAAAQQNLNAVAGQSLTIPTAGGHGLGPGVGAGKGAATRAEMTAWATKALTQTESLGHGGATPGNIAKILTLAMKESSWIVDSINNWDINAKNGNPSGGLMHVTIDKVGGSREALFDPVKNMVASIRYQMSRYKSLITFSPYAQGGLIDTMDSKTWARGGMVERPTLMTGEDGRKAPEYVIGTNPSFRKNNIQALTNAAKALGVPMARKSKTGTIKPSFVNGQGRDPENLREVKRYATVQTREDDKRREISIAESKVKEPDTLIKQQGTDALGNPLYVVDQSKLDAYVAMMKSVKDLYDDLINNIMKQLSDAASRAYEALLNYRNDRTANIQQLDNQNAVNKRLMKSKDKGTREAAERRFNAGVEMRGQQVGLRNDAEGVRARIQDDQRDAGYRVQEYGVSRQSIVDDIAAVGNKAAADALSETKSAYSEPEKVDAPDTPGMQAVDRLETEYALAQAGYGMNGQLGGRDINAIVGDLIKANELRITEAQGMLTDADATNDKEAYSALSTAANAIKGLKEELASTSPGLQSSNLSTAMMDLYKSMGGNFSLAQGGLSAGNQVAAAMGAPMTGAGVAGISGPGGGGVTVNIEQSFPEQPDPVTWAAATNYELNAAL